MAEHGEDTMSEIAEALCQAHEWLERVVATRGGYFSLDHKLGENNEGCALCAAFVDAEAAERKVEERTAERDHWVRLFNRLETATRRHVEAKEATGFSDEADDALAAAHRSVMKAVAEAR